MNKKRHESRWTTLEQPVISSSTLGLERSVSFEENQTPWTKIYKRNYVVQKDRKKLFYSLQSLTTDELNAKPDENR